MHAPDALNSTLASPDALLASSSEPLADEEARWVAAATRGDAEATLELLARYRPPLVRLLAGVMGDWSAAEDAVQESFLQAFRNLKQLRDPHRFYPWVRRSALRLAVKAVRGRKELPFEAAADMATTGDPAGVVEQRILIAEILARIPADLRVTLVLREMEGMDYAEIAEELGIPIGTVRSRLFAAREQFRRVWEERHAD